MKAIITSTKHIVQKSLATIEEQTISNITILRVKFGEPTTVSDVVVGSVVKAVYLEYWLLGESAQPCTCTWSFEKLPNDGTVMTQAQGQALNSYPNKRNLFHIGQGIIGDSNANPIPVMRGWYKIPKGKQRMALGDELQVNFSVIGQTDNGMQVCGFALYKEYQ